MNDTSQALRRIMKAIVDATPEPPDLQADRATVRFDADGSTPRRRQVFSVALAAAALAVVGLVGLVAVVLPSTDSGSLQFLEQSYPNQVGSLRSSSTGSSTGHPIQSSRHCWHGQRSPTTSRWTGATHSKRHSNSSRTTRRCWRSSRRTLTFFPHPSGFVLRASRRRGCRCLRLRLHRCTSSPVELGPTLGSHVPRR